MEIYIVRHGRTEANAAGVLLGRADPNLDHVGREQAERIAQSLPPMDRVISSPLTRCVETARWVADSPEIEEAMIEVDYGVYDLMPLKSVPADVWSKWTSDLDFVPEGGESMAAMGRRVHSFLDTLAIDQDSERVAVFTHVSPVKASLAWALGAPMEITFRAQVSQASVSVIETAGQRVALLGFNSTSHLVE